MKKVQNRVTDPFSLADCYRQSEHLPERLRESIATAVYFLENQRLQNSIVIEQFTSIASHQNQLFVFRMKQLREQFASIPRAKNPTILPVEHAIIAAIIELGEGIMHTLINRVDVYVKTREIMEMYFDTPCTIEAFQKAQRVLSLLHTLGRVVISGDGQKIAVVRNIVPHFNRHKQLTAIVAMNKFTSFNALSYLATMLTDDQDEAIISPIFARLIYCSFLRPTQHFLDDKHRDGQQAWGNSQLLSDIHHPNEMLIDIITNVHSMSISYKLSNQTMLYRGKRMPVSYVRSYHDRIEFNFNRVVKMSSAQLHFRIHKAGHVGTQSNNSATHYVRIIVGKPQFNERLRVFTSNIATYYPISEMEFGETYLSTPRSKTLYQF